MGLPRDCPGRMAWIHFYGFQACGAVARPGGFALAGSLLWFWFKESILIVGKTREVSRWNPHLMNNHTSGWRAAVGALN